MIARSTVGGTIIINKIAMELSSFYTVLQAIAVTPIIGMAQEIS